MDDYKLAFLSYLLLENNSCIRGGILITDIFTKPLEFRVTSTIKPTSFQKTLYGDTLLEHILVELIGIPLLNDVTKTPDFVLVRNPLFLGINDKMGVKVIRLYKEDEITYEKPNSNNQQLSSMSGKYESIFFETTKNFEGELPEIRKFLMDIFAKKNLLEPFERMNMAIQEVHIKNLVS